MTSPARAHFLRRSAQQQVPDSAEAQHHARLSAYEQQLAQLHDHRRRLKDAKALARKIELKRQFLPEYAAWIQGVLAGDHGAQDEVFITCLVWTMDVGDWTAALHMAEYALRHGLVLPDHYKRDLATLVAEEVADAALKPGGLGVPLDSLIEAELLTKDHDLHDQVRAKLRKAIGFAFRERGEAASALEYLKQALSLFEQVGVKKDIERLERELKSPPAGGKPDPVTGDSPAT
ncbi:phage terminase small subunit [Chitiniphilus eburneus]|uniref:phage terminase small subunit n=1 Tax=Chitiniphilus eburneus TaxID=2571148 RepID=UPI0035CF39BA